MGGKNAVVTACRNNMNRLFIHQMHPQVNRDIISEMSLPTHPPFQLHHLADATGGSEASQNISAISSFPPKLCRFTSVTDRFYYQSF